MTRYRAGLVLVLIAVLGLLGCAGGQDSTEGAQAARDGQTGPAVRIGTKNFTEQYILGELYRQALEAEGFRVNLKRDIGSSEIIHHALTGGGLDMYPEYVGVLLSEVADDHQRPRDARAAYQRAKAFEESNGFTLLAMTPFSDSNALAVSDDFARRRNVTRIPELESASRDAIRIAAPPEFRTRFEGLLGLREVGALRDVELESLRIGAQYDALDRGAVDAAAIFTTDGQLAARRYVLLEDPEGLFAAQHVAPVIDRDTLEAHGPKLRATIDAVSRRLTTRAMREMNAAVDLDGEDPAAVAERFLVGEDLL